MAQGVMGAARVGALQRHYEDPATRLNSGGERAQLQGAWLCRLAESAGRPLLVADVGCGDGISTAIAVEAAERQRGAELRFVGFDWSAAAVVQAHRRGLPTARASVDAPGLPLGTSSVDVVVMSELVEHLTDPDAALDEAFRVLAPGGSLLLSTPNLAAWFNRVLLAAGIQPLFTEVSLRGIYGRPGREVVGHLRLFTRRALAQVLSAHGFSDVVVEGAPYHDVPRPFRPLDRWLCRTPSLASILLASARKPLVPATGSRGASDLATP